MSTPNKQAIINAAQNLLCLLKAYIKYVDDPQTREGDYWVTQSKVKGLEVLYFTLTETFKILEKTLNERISIHELD